MPYEELVRQLAEIRRQMVKFPAYTKMSDASRGEGVLLHYLAQHNGEATPVELSEALNVSTARIAALLNKMEHKQWILRQKHPKNKRNVMVKLLPDGRRQYEQRAAAFSQNAIAFFETLGPEKAAVFVALQCEMLDFMIKQANRGGE